MRIRNFALGGLIALVAGLAALFAVPAGAQGDYPPGGSTVSLSSVTVEQGGTLSGTVSNFEQGTATGEYNPTFTFEVGADGTGSFSHTIAADQAPGEYTLTITSATGADTASTTFTVVAAQDGGTAGGDLPRTGSDSSLPLAQTAVAALAAGGLMVLVARRRMATA